MQKPLFSAFLIGVAACSGGGTKPSGISTGDTTALRVASTQTGGGEGDALAGSLLLSAGLPVSVAGRPDFRMADRKLAKELVFRGLSHLQASSFGAAAGASGAGSERIRRLAKGTSAPPDTNGNGTNLDEMWASELAALSQSAGAAPLPIDHPLLFAWSRGSAELEEPSAGKTESDVSAWRTLPSGDDLVMLEQVAMGLGARVLAALTLLSENRGSLIGADPESGRLGVLLLQQAVAVEETLVAQLFFDGISLGRLANPGSYDPKNGRRWLPASFRVAIADQPVGAPEGYAPVERSSSLLALATLLEAETQLAWIGSDLNPDPNLRDLLRGRPFGEPAGPRRPRETQPLPLDGGRGEVTYETDIKPLIALYYCSSCHNGSATYALLDTRTYEGLLRGGVHQTTNPSIVKGDAPSSLLYQTLLAEVPGISGRMPQNGPYMNAGELSLVADWINGGAKKEPSIPIPPPRIGLDLARALVKNLGAMHFDPETGALYDRHDGDAPLRWASASSTGAALSALALWLELSPKDSDARSLLTLAADFAREALCDSGGKVVQGFDLDLAVPTGEASLVDQARLCAGLLAAGHALGNEDALIRGRKLGSVLLSEVWWDDKSGLFRTESLRQGRRYTPTVVSAVLAALRELAADSVPTQAAAVHDRLLTNLRPFLAFSEWSGNGEVLGDGIPDTDKNGIPEPSASRGGNGCAPLLAGEILQGPSPAQEPVAEPVTWSRHIAPLFRATCVGCHVDGASRGNYRVDTPKQTRTPGDSGGTYPLIEPGNPEGSLLYRMLVDRNPAYGHQMPLQKPPLDDRGKELVRLWIEQGATGR